jgi:hypothetical protein
MLVNLAEVSPVEDIGPPVVLPLLLPTALSGLGHHAAPTQQNVVTLQHCRGCGLPVRE